MAKYEFNLASPIIFFDLETTGTNFQSDRIVEISLAKILPGGEMEIKTRRINPEKHIPLEVSEIHGIYDEDVKDKPTFKAIASSLYLYMEKCDLAGYNVKRFDIPLLTEEFKRAGLEFSLEGRNIVDMQTIYHKREPRTLAAAYKYFCDKNLDDAHSAEADVLASIEVLQGQLRKYQDLPNDMDKLSEYCDQSDPTWIDSTGKFKWVEGEAVVAFSKHSGTTIRELAATEPGFFKWMLKQSFRKDAMQIAQDALVGKFPVKKPEENKE
ncbi:MAG: ribonuclease H-like domain-containing protein [Victivallales bacterium]|nr:ribonuclease H-like domain-containing protein [Victivallales bacterium]